MTQHHTQDNSQQADHSTIAEQCTPQQEDSQPVGDAVLDIIADFEAQLQRIRAAQASSEQQLASLADRSRALAEAEKSLQDKARQAAIQREAIEQASRVLDEDRVKFERHQRESMQRIEEDHAQATRMRRELEQQQASSARLEHQWQERSKELEQARAHWEKQRQQADAAHEQAHAELMQREATIKSAWHELDQARQQASAATHDAEERLRRAEAELTHHYAQLDKQKSELQQRQATCEANTRQFEQARAAWEQQRRELEAELAAKSAVLARREAELAQERSGIQQRDKALAESQNAMASERQRLESLELQLKRDRDDLAKSTRSLELDKRELTARVEQAERNVGELVQRLEVSQGAIEQKSIELSSAAQRVHALEAKLEQAHASLQEARHQARRLQEREAELKNQVKQESNRARKGEAERDEARAALENVQAEQVSMRSRVDSLTSDLEARRGELADARKKLDVAGKKLSQFAQTLKEQTAQIERGAEAMATVEEQRLELAHLTEELARYKLSTDPAEIVRRDERIRELTEALREARGQCAAGGDVAEKEQRLADMSSTIDELRLKLQQAEVELETAKRKLEERRDDQGGESDAAVAARLAERDARIAELTTRLERLDSDFSSQRSSAQRSVQEHRGIVAGMQDRIDTLERQLIESRASASAARDAAELSPRKNDLRNQARRIRELAEHLRTRKQRLERMHRRLRELRPAPGGTGMTPASSPDHSDSIRREIEERARFTEQIHLERQRLAQTQATLAAAEREMVKKWARPRAIWTMGWCAALLAIIATASWLIADHVAPPTVAASITLHAKSPTGAPLSEADLDQWREFHVTMLADGQFRTTLAQRFGDHQLAPYDNLAILNNRLDTSLTIDTSVRDKLRLTMSGNDRHELLTVLDTLGTTFMKESSRSKGKHSDGAEAVLRGEYKDGAQTRYATLNPRAIEDTRLQVAAITFGVLTAVCVTVFVILSVRLGRARRAFEDELALAPLSSHDDEDDSQRVQIT